ncbi:5608_t:CDS:2, partial [Gigaspora margarita]
MEILLHSRILLNSSALIYSTEPDGLIQNLFILLLKAYLGHTWILENNENTKYQGREQRRS